MTLRERNEAIRKLEQGAITRGDELVVDDRTEEQRIMEGLGAGGYSALNSVLMGLPDFLVKNVGGSEKYQDLVEYKERNKKASLAGDIAGTLGSFLIPGGAIVKGAGMGAKALGAVRTGDKLIDAARLLKTGGQIGKLGKIGSGVVRGAGQAAEQGITRGITGLDFNSAEALGESAKEGLTDAATATLLGGGIGGITGKLGGSAKNLLSKYGDEALDVAEDTLMKNIGFNRSAIEGAAKLGISDDIAAGAKTLSGEVLEKRAVNEFTPKLREQGYKILDKLGIGNKTDFKNIFVGKSPDEIGDIIKKVIPDIDAKDFKRLHHLVSGVGAELIGDVTSGLDASKVFSNPAVLASLIGGGGISVGKDALQGNIDSGTVSRAAIGAAGGLAAAKYGPKVLAKLLTGGGKGALKAADALAEATPGKIVQAVQQGVIELPKAAAIVKLKSDQNENPQETVAEKESTMAPEEVQAATQEFSQQFKNVMNKQLNSIYDNYYSDMDPKDFMEKVATQTDNFQNMSAMSNILYMGDEEGSKNFLRKYDAYLALKDLDFDMAIDKPGMLSGLLGGGKDIKAANETLVNTLATMVSKGDISDRPKAIKQVEKDIEQIRENPDLIGQFMETYGLGFDDLRELGLAD